MESELSGYVTLTLSFEQEGSEWVGTCLELGTSTFADTLEECQVELEELVTDHLDVLEEVCERERFFEEWGIDIHTDEVPGEFTMVTGQKQTGLGRDGLLRLIERRWRTRRFPDASLNVTQYGVSVIA